MFEEQNNKINEIDKKRWYHYKLWQEYSKEYKKLKDELESECDHEWIVDRTSFDICRTQYKCKKCNC